jgi:iron complex outermembrane receptor protein
MKLPKLTLLSIAMMSCFNVYADIESSELESMVVTATRNKTSTLNTPARVTVVDSDTMERRLTLRIGDALKDTPGLYLRGSMMGNNFPGSGQSAMSLHGVSGSKRSLLLIDGQPINSASSSSINWNSFMTEDAAQIEVVPGPFSALYGSGAMGGVINMISKVPTERELSLTTGGGGGSVDQWWMRGAYRDRFDNGIGITINFNHTDSMGWDDSDYVIGTPTTTKRTTNPLFGAIPTQTSQGTQAYWIGLKGARPWTQDNAQIKLFYDFSDKTNIVAGFAWDRTDSGYSPYTSFLHNSSGQTVDNLSTASINGQAFSVAPVSFLTSTPSYEETRRYFTRFNHDFGDDITLKADFSFLDLAFMSPTASNSATAKPPVTYDGGAGQLSAIPNSRLDGTVSLRMPFFLERNFLTVGFSGNKNSLNSGRIALSNFRDENSGIGYDYRGKGSSTLLSGFIQDEWGLLKNLTAHIGGRFDYWETDGQISTAPTANNPTTPNFTKNYESRSVSQFNPKFALVWNPIEKSKLFASAGWAFRPPTLSDLYSTSVTTSQIGGARVTSEAAPNLKPETMFSWEIGGEARIEKTGTTIGAAYFRHYLRNLIYTRTITTLTANDTSILDNAGKAQVEGVEIKFSQDLYWDWLRLTGTYSLSDSKITENIAKPSTVGKQMTQLPKNMYSIGLEAEKAGWSGSIIGRYTQHTYSNDDNLDTVSGVFGSYDSFFKMDMRLNYQINHHVKLGVSADNVLDRDYFQFYKQPGRSVYGELTLSY